MAYVSTHTLLYRSQHICLNNEGSTVARHTPDTLQNDEAPPPTHVVALCFAGILLPWANAAGK